MLQFSYEFICIAYRFNIKAGFSFFWTAWGQGWGAFHKPPIYEIELTTLANCGFGSSSN